MALDPKTKRELAKQGRLWGLSLICATGGATAVYLTDRLAIGIAVFAACLIVFGSALFLYEKWHKS